MIKEIDTEGQQDPPATLFLKKLPADPCRISLFCKMTNYFVVFVTPAGKHVFEVKHEKYPALFSGLENSFLFSFLLATA